MQTTTFIIPKYTRRSTLYMKAPENLVFKKPEFHCITGKKKIKERKTLENYAKFSEYVNQKTNYKTTSFKYLNNYISMINEAPLQSYIIAMMTNHPELTVTERFDDMKRSSSAVTVSSLIITLNDTSHEELIRWFINLKQKEI